MPIKTSKPNGALDLMVTTCTPLETSVDFFGSQTEAQAFAREQIVPGVTTYVGRVIRQGMHTERPDDLHVAVLATLSPAQLARVRAEIRGTGHAPSRKAVAKLLTNLLATAIAKL